MLYKFLNILLLPLFPAAGLIILGQLIFPVVGVWGLFAEGHLGMLVYGLVGGGLCYLYTNFITGKYDTILGRPADDKLAK